LNQGGDCSAGALRASSCSLVFGDRETEQVLELRNESDAVASFTIKSSASWLTTSAESGYVGSEPEQIGVSVDRRSLSLGQHEAALSIDVGGGQALYVTAIATVSSAALETASPSGGDPAGSGSADPTGGGTSGQLYVVPTSLNFGLQTDTAIIYVRNRGEGELSYEVTADVGWITLGGASGSSAGEYRAVTVRVEREGLAEGEYHGTVTVSAGNEQVQVGVQLAVSESGDGSLEPVLSINADELDFGTVDTQQSFWVENTGGRTLSYTVTSDVGWASVSPSRGTCSDEQDQVVVTVLRESLPPGQYTGLISVETDDGQWRGLVLRMGVTGPQSLFEVDAGRLDFGTEGLQLSFTVRYNGEGGMGYSISQSDSWFSLQPSFGTATGTPQTIWVTVTRCEHWSAGVQEGELGVEADDGQHVVIPVFVEVMTTPSHDGIAQTLAPLPALPKVHYSWPLPPEMLEDANDPLLQEWIRITHAAGLSANWLTESWVNVAVEAVQEVNDQNPDIPATISLAYSPYHFDGWPYGAPPTYSGPEYATALDRIRANFVLAKTWLEQANAALGANVAVSAILLDCELWFVEEDDVEGHEEWNAALDEKHDAVYDICKSLFPDAIIHWYHRGLPPGYRLFTLREQGDSASPALYHTPEPDVVRWGFRQVYDEAQAHGISLVIPWFALGEAYWTLPNGYRTYICDLNYELSLSWQLGAEVNGLWDAQPPDDSTPWEAASQVIFYPGPFSLTRAPHFPAHFAAYVRGAHDLPVEP
jgi:hypothetical protein